jgi:copper chaperone CopZ
MRPDLWSTTPSESSSRVTVTVRGMTCRHCAEAVDLELRRIPGVQRVTIDLDDGRVAVLSSTPVSASAISDVLREVGHPVDGH